GGKYVAPQPIENTFKESFLVEQMMVIGDAKKFVSALIVPSFQHLKSWCDQHQVPFVSNTEVLKNPKIIARYQELVNDKNKHLGHTEQIKRFHLVPEEWTVQGGQLTPTMKLKRKVIVERYKSLIEEMYFD
ncbi:MAG: long-chain fatty acid--CoA ligase, partial [Chitinophagales bacterium]|nr:long-chain fatty acid--CoA ligase [Chitinophagales bacterium]